MASLPYSISSKSTLQSNDYYGDTQADGLVILQASFSFFALQSSVRKQIENLTSDQKGY
jgi:hypothetical protein